MLCLALFASFVAIGVMIATLFGRRSERIGRLYFADLIGAGLACAIVGPAPRLGSAPPATIFLAGAGPRRLRACAIALRRVDPCAVWLAPCWPSCSRCRRSLPSCCPTIASDDVKAELDDDAPFSSGARSSASTSPTSSDVGILLYHDGLLGSAIYQFDGDVDEPRRLRFDTDPRSFPFATLGAGAGAT